jgi:hypothetical protein
MTYAELQKKAASLGLQAVGVPKKDLIAAISAAEAGEETGENPTPEAQAPEKPKPSKKFNTAIVFNDSNEVRRYSLDQHGKDFLKLANQYADKRKYRVEAVEASAGIVCPGCGHRFVID